MPGVTALTHEATRVVPRRCAQWLLDLLVVMVVSVIVAVATLIVVVKAGGHGRWVLHVAVGTYIGSIIVLQALNELFLPRRTGGRTLGMVALGLRVVTMEGSLPSWKQFFVRYLLWIVDGLFWGVAGLVVMCCTPYRQRVGDLVARTVVVRARRGSADEAVFPGPDGELGAVAQSELALGAGQVRLDGRE
jgi:uncharacterized RDD family membrane protein YckC